MQILHQDISPTSVSLPYTSSREDTSLQPNIISDGSFKSWTVYNVGSFTKRNSNLHLTNPKWCILSKITLQPLLKEYRYLHIFFVELNQDSFNVKWFPRSSEWIEISWCKLLVALGQHIPCPRRWVPPGSIDRPLHGRP